jgi:anthranilate 1,2-dioxygenase small subunit
MNDADATRLLLRYADALDEWRLEDWADLFAADGRYEIIPRENLCGLPPGRDPMALMYCPDRRFIDDRVAAIRKATLYGPHRYRHVYGPVVAEPRGDGTTAVRTNYAVYRIVPSGETDVFSVGTVEAVASDSPAPRLRSVRIVCDTALISGYLVLPL